MALTGQLEIGLINTQPQRLFAFSWAFWVLLFTSAYTANLANFFVTKSASSFQVQTVADAVRLEMSICVRAGAGIYEDIRKEYPHVNLVLSDSVARLFQRFNDEECDILAIDINSWIVERVKKEVNADCDWFWNGVVQLVKKGGAVMMVDSLCSSIISQSVDIHLKAMVEHGEVATIMEKYASLVLVLDRSFFSILSSFCACFS
jgi:hypothetical protein